MSKKRVTAIITTMMMACSLFAGFTISAQDVVDVEKEPQQVVAAEDQGEVTQVPTATLSAYDDAANKRTVTVSSDVTDTIIKVYADKEKQDLLATGTKGTGSVDVERGANAADSSVVKALNLGVLYVTATKDGQTESDAVEVTAAARTNKTALTGNVELDGTYLVAKDGAVDTVVPALPMEATVPVTYNEQTGEEGDTATGAVALENWAWAADADSSETGDATAEAAFAAKGNIVLQDNSTNYKAQVTVSVIDDTVTAVDAVNETVTYTASEAYTRGSETGLDALKAHLNANEKVIVTYETAGEQQPVATTWELVEEEDSYNPKSGTYHFESAAIGGQKATITVEVTEEVAQLSENATAKELYISGLDENLNLIIKPKDADAAIALMPKTATATFEDSNVEEYTISWAVGDFEYGDGVQTVTDGETLGTMTRTVAVPEWVTTEPALNESPDTVTVKVDASVAGVNAAAANFPEQDNDMILIKPENQESQAMKALVVKENTVIEFYASNDADDDEPVMAYTVTAEDAAAGKVLLQGEDISYDFPQNNAGELYVGVKIDEIKTKAENRMVMTIEPEPQVTFTNTNASLSIGDTINQTAKLNGSTGAYSIDTSTIVWESANTAVVTVGTNKSLVTTVKGIGSGNTTVTFSGEVKHPFADELEGTAPTATVEVSKVYTVTRDINGGGGGGNRPGSSTGTGGSTVVVPSNDSYFDDIDDVAWAKDQINALAANGIINGVDNRTFAPNNTITRAEFAKMVVNAFGLFDAGATMNFVDTAGHEQDWYYPYVASAAKVGIIQGYSEDNTFRPQQTITRQDMCVMIVRACEATGRFLSSGQQSIVFSDAADIMDYAKEAVDQMTSAGIINGMGDNMFVPQGNATRAQAAKVIYDVLY